MRILAVDLGTSSVKFLRLDDGGRVLSINREPMSGLSVEGWVSALERNLQEHGDQAEVGGIAVTGQMHGLMTRENGDMWGEGIPWHDARSAAIIPSIVEMMGPDAVMKTGGPIAPGFLAASLAWVREHDPERWGRIRSVLLPKDALIHELTGEHVTDPSDAAGTGLYAPEAHDWAWTVVDALGIPHAWLPRLMPAGSIAGGLRPEYAALLGLPRGLPIIIAGGDAPTGAYGAGVMRDSDALVMLSTGAQVIVPARSWSPDPEGRWYTWPSVAPEATDHAPYLKVGTLLNAGNVTSYADAILGGGDIDNEPSGVFALPHLIGTREDPDQRAAIVGLTAGTSAGTIRRALIEGIAFSVRAKLEEMTGNGGVPARILLGGGLAQRADVRQLFADVLGIPVHAVSQPEITAYGAALLAQHNLTGWVPEEEIESCPLSLPNANHSYDAHYALYREMERALLPLTERIAALGNDLP